MLRIGRIHILTDTHLQTRYSHYELAQMAIAEGIPTLQYREKAFTPEKHLEELKKIAALARQYHTQLIINDLVEVAAEIGATGVHLGESDMPIEEALHRLPAFTLIGATVHSLERYQAIRHLPIAYVGVGPVFETQTKDVGRPPLGIEGLRQFVEAITQPVIAIGGITPPRAAELFRAIPKLHGVAVLSAFCTADDPRTIARELLALLPQE
ncbi:MAG: thiamine phosphate synthase [Bacteroidia bacterium]|jgi:thiamine-phosphate pyrophosphorylase|nr:thiamine phosphate synthase [Bacteroidia bacterium]GIV22400.1 MAG: thiamine-phosphate synthase [Bacteroidia bacterium]